MNQTLEQQADTGRALALLAHYQCPCQEDLPPGVKVALCGTHILGVPAIAGSDDCVVCDELIEEPCPICGD